MLPGTMSMSEREAGTILGADEVSKRRKRHGELWSSGWESAIFRWTKNLETELPLEHSKAEKDLLELYGEMTKEEALEEEEKQKRIVQQDTVTKRLHLAATSSTAKPKLAAPTTASAVEKAVAAAQRAEAAESAIAPAVTTTEKKEEPSAEQPHLSVPKRAKKAQLEPEPVEAPPDATAIWGTSADAGYLSSPEDSDSKAPWISTENDGADFYPIFKLPKYGANNTLVAEISVAPDADRWALNLCPLIHDDAANILFHMNPRRLERGGVVVLNDKLDDNWHRANKQQFADLPATFFGLDHALLKLQLDVVVDASTEKKLFVNGTINDQPFCSFKSRLPGPPDTADVLFLGSTHDDFGNPESLTIHKLWWGWHPPLPRLPMHLRPHVQRQQYW